MNHHLEKDRENRGTVPLSQTYRKADDAIYLKRTEKPMMLLTHKAALNFYFRLWLMNSIYV